MNPQEHVAAALDFLELADSAIAERNPLLHSELLWCAAAHAVKSVAKRRGWRNESHADLFEVARRLSTTADVRISRWFRQANLLHRNMYEGEMDEEKITISQGQMRRMVHRLAELVG